MQNGIVVIAEHADGKVKPITYEIIAFAGQLQQLTQQAIVVLIVGAEVSKLTGEIAEQSGLDVKSFEVPGPTGYNAEIYRKVLVEHFRIHRPAYVCAAQTSQGQDFAPVLAVELAAACISGVEVVYLSEEGIVFERALYSGKIKAGIRPVSETAVVTVQPGIFKFTRPSGVAAGRVDLQSLSIEPSRSRSLGIRKASPAAAGITEAEVIVAAGRGIGEQDNLDLIHQLAALFGKSAVAGSRLVCDLGWLEYRCQVGVTGATVAPRLYIACGISGAFQHVTGMRGSQFIVAINKDPAAAIFQVADVCIVEDLTTFIPKFIEVWQEKGKINQ